MKIIVKNIKGEKKEIEINEDSLIEELQKEVEKQYGVLVEQQRLIHKGKNMNPKISLKEQGVHDLDCIILMALKTETLKKKEETKEEQPQQQQVAAQEQSVQQQVSVQAQQQTPQNILQDFVPSNAQKEESIKELMDMGFSKEIVIQSLEAAFYDKETAVNYLLNGIPEEIIDDEQGTQYSQTEGQQSIQLTQEQAQVIQQIRSSPEFQTFLNQLRENPNLLNEMLVQLSQTNPQLFQIFQQNPNLLIALLQGDVQFDDEQSHQHQGDQQQDNQQESVEVHLTANEMRDVQEMMQMGFSQNECIEAYMVCDKNKEHALNFLLDGKFN